ncbi:MAG: outer membrane beta-barrel protein [Acidobacteriota bacterium]
MRTKRLALGVGLLGVFVLPAMALELDEASLDGRLSYFKPTNSPDTFDANFGGGEKITLGVGGTWKWDKGLFVQACLDYYSESGEKVYVGGGSTQGTGFGTDIKIIPITATGGWTFLKKAAVSPYVGAGVGYYLVDVTDGDADNVFGYHILGGVEFLKKRSFGMAAEVRLSWAPSALGHGGTSQLFNEDDVGGLTITVKGLWRYKD